MTSITKFTSIAIPTVLGIGAAWLGVQLIKKEGKIKQRKMELELQLSARSIKGI